ncbi:MAG: hypothetical protein N3E49_08420 [Bacteroidia bacterium]|nr:hypothetical protein [Bacteroidia bacterium]
MRALGGCNTLCHLFEKGMGEGFLGVRQRLRRWRTPLLPCYSQRINI